MFRSCGSLLGEGGGGVPTCSCLHGPHCLRETRMCVCWGEQGLMLMATRDRDLLLITSLREKLKAGAAAGAVGYGGSRKGPRAEDVVKLFETIGQVRDGAPWFRGGKLLETIGQVRDGAERRGWDQARMWRRLDCTLSSSRVGAWATVVLGRRSWRRWTGGYEDRCGPCPGLTVSRLLSIRLL